MRRTLLFSLIAGLLLLGQLALAQPPGRGQGRGPAWNQDTDGRPGMNRMVKGLNLTDEQLNRMDDLKLQLQKEMIPLQSDLTRMRSELHLMMTDDNPNMGRINKKIGEISDVRRQMQEKQISHRMEVRKLLDETQKKRFDAMLLNSRKGQRGGFGHRAGFRGGPG
ncbi:MAG: Spy/CpxP family protein refolding chaperone, partial [Calditrichia bacterium]